MTQYEYTLATPYGERGWNAVSSDWGGGVAPNISDDEASVLRPEKELKGFEKVFLQPGETRTLTFTVKEEDLQYFDADAHAWVAEPGTFTARLGFSAGNIAAEEKFTLK